MNENENRYLSLKAAARLYGYTRDHLGLMIRRGKLNGRKLGNYYVVTNEWMLQYIKNFADPAHPVAKSKMSNRFLNEALTFGQRTKSKDISSASKEFGSKKDFKKESKNNLEKELSVELSILSASSASKKYTKKIESKNYIGAFSRSYNFKNTEPKSAVEYPYIILPIRKMNADERENILNRTLNQEIKKYTA